jgi:DNA polymerase-1
MQGTAADIIKRAMIGVAAWLEAEEPRARLIMQVHDELVMEVPGDRAARVGASVARIMEGAAQLRTPLRVDMGMGANWDEAH